MSLDIDTERTRSAARRWVEWGDAMQQLQLTIDAEIEALQLANWYPLADDRLGDAANLMWSTAVFVTLVCERAEAADTFDPTSAQALALLRQAGLGFLSAGPGTSGYSDSNGELGDTYLAELRSPYIDDAESDLERGREMIIRALMDTASGDQIRQDEFQIVQLSDGRYLVVLPGVTDLSSPDLGLSDENRTVRDVDQGAYGSSTSTSVADNDYARMVWEALRERGVPVGAELVMVGHSYGADTVLDLAADESFNGPGGYRVTHAIAAAYASDSQLAHVPDRTEVLVLQNSVDVPVIIENVGASGVTDLANSTGGAAYDYVTGDPVGLAGNLWGMATSSLETAWSGTEFVWNNKEEIAKATGGVLTSQPVWVVDGAHDIVTIDPGVSKPTDTQTVAVFPGAFEGAGHDQDNYIDYVGNTTDEHVVAFFESLGGSGSAVGSVHAIDVSVPD